MASITKNRLILLRNITIKILLPLLTILGIWEVLYLITDNSYILPSIPETALSISKIIGGKDFIFIVLLALFRVVMGLVWGIVLGSVLATLCHYLPVLNSIFSPIISIMKATPVACIIVLLWIRMNYNQITIFVVILMVMPIVWQNVLDAFNSIDKDLLEVAEIFEFTGITKFKVLIFPTIIKYLIPATITSVGLAWKAEVAAEIMTNSNMGRLIYNYKNITYDTASIFAWTIIIVTLSLVFENSAKYFLRRLSDEPINKEH